MAYRCSDVGAWYASVHMAAGIQPHADALQSQVREVGGAPTAQITLRTGRACAPSVDPSCKHAVGIALERVGTAW